MNIESYIKKYRNEDLTGEQIQSVIGSTPVLYTDLKNYNSIFDLLPKAAPYKIILIQVSSITSGHYVAIWLNYASNTIYYFDSYGYKVDKPITLGLAKYDTTNHIELYLTKLINASGCKLWENIVDYQSKKDVRISTCGRWSSTAIRLRNLFPREFGLLFKGNVNKYLNQPDNVITLLTLLDFKSLV